MSTGMRVLVFRGPHDMTVEYRPVPEPGAGEVRLRVAYVGICGSDLHGYTGESGRRVPGMVMGHEASGWVEALGPGVDGFEIGEPVTFNPALACDGSCGHAVENQCTQLRIIGVTPELQGAFADSVLVPAGRLVPLTDVGLQAGATVEPMAVGLQAARRAGVDAGARVLVIGAGMIGQCIAQAARHEGAGEIVLVDTMAARRDMAAVAGFEACPPEGVAERAPFDITFDAVGVSATAALAIGSVHKGGTSCFVGLGTPQVDLPLFDLVVAERVIVGSFCYTDAIFEETVHAIGAGALDTAPFLGPAEDFEAAPAAFEALAAGARSDVKIMVGTGNEPPAVS